MTIVGINFTKISVERKQVARGKININNNISIKGVEETDLALGSNKQAGLRFLFEYVSKYDPKVGEIILEGDVLYLTDVTKAKQVVKDWKKEKKIPKEYMGEVLNAALSKCNVEALILSRDVNMPPPIPLPKVGIKPKEYIG